MTFISKILSIFKKEEKKDAPEPEDIKTVPEPGFGLDEEMLGNGVSAEPKEDNGMSGLFNGINEEKDEEAGGEPPVDGSSVAEEPPFAPEISGEKSQK